MYPPALSNPTSDHLLIPKLHKGREMSMVTQDMKARAEIYYGDDTCREKFMFLLNEIGLPNGLLAIEEIEECGYIKRDYHKFENVVISYHTEVTAYFEHKKIKNLTGVKAKEFLIWITLSEIYVKDNSRDAASITFKTPAGLSKSFPLSLSKYEAIVAPGEMDVDEVKRDK